MKVLEVFKRFFHRNTGGTATKSSGAEECHNYSCILKAYEMSFLFRDGAYYVGNHRLDQDFNLEQALLIFAGNRFDGHVDGHAVCKILKTDKSYDLAVAYKGFAVVINSNIRIEYGDVTWNFATEINREYERNINKITENKAMEHQ